MKFLLEISRVIALDSYEDIYVSEKTKKKAEDDGIFCSCALSHGSSSVVCGSECDCGYASVYTTYFIELSKEHLQPWLSTFNLEKINLCVGC